MTRKMEADIEARCRQSDRSIPAALAAPSNLGKRLLSSVLPGPVESRTSVDAR